MKPTTITVDVLSLKSIDKAIKDIEKYIEKIKRLETELPKVLAEFGREDAQMRFDYSVYDIYGGSFGLEAGTGGGTDVEVRVEEIENGFAIVAEGEHVCFVEFGAGVFYNGEDAYLGERPEGIVGIGEFGQGKGKRKSWFFTDEFGVTHMSRGTPASNSMYFTMRDIEDRVAEEARRILND